MEGGMYVGGFPHKCQLVAKSISISHRRGGEVLLEMLVLDVRITSSVFQ